jgi:hypothetical protein
MSVRFFPSLSRDGRTVMSFRQYLQRARQFLKSQRRMQRPKKSGRLLTLESLEDRTVLSPIADKYAALGGPQGFLGQPTTAELIASDGVGHYEHFQGGSIYWSPATAAHEIHGAIRDEWARRGWERSFLGYPVSDGLSTDYRADLFHWSYFQNGLIKSALPNPDGVPAGVFAVEDNLLWSRYNEARQMSSHNSYDGDGPKDDYDTQLEKGVRSFEVDLHLSDQHSNWDVYHTTNVFSGGDFTDNLIGFLRRMRQWHDAHPNHEVITLWLEICTFREVITLLRRPAGRPGR